MSCCCRSGPNLGEFYQFEQAWVLSIELLIKWLFRYRFKDRHRVKPWDKEVPPI